VLDYIRKDKQGDVLVDTLCARFTSIDETLQWRNVAFCLTQVSHALSPPSAICMFLTVTTSPLLHWPD
jgi:hypothetical protein